MSEETKIKELPALTEQKSELLAKDEKNIDLSLSISADEIISNNKSEMKIF
eukprot:TRINITY_DN10162_c0_g1_i1.p1 TRINITY_DN10162_c0_g1~~TRINITY_DN10162_c0_g1_i1.p1  ORF type:complete len:51 (+),score=19.37 TRINITY_DN10162_c0_g1_i1:96-248(+)